MRKVAFTIDAWIIAHRKRISQLNKKSIVSGLGFAAIYNNIRNMKDSSEYGEQSNEILKVISDHERALRIMDQMSYAARVGGWEVDLQTQEFFWTKETHLIHETDYTSFIPTLENVIDFVVPDHQAIYTDAINELVGFGKPFDLEIELYTATKRKIWVHFVGRPYYENNQLVKVFGAVQDITEKKLDEARMVYSSRMASLGEMGSSIAHEINNPLGVIAVRAQLIRGMIQKEKLDVEKLKSYIDTIIQTTERIEKIVKGLRSFARDGEKQPMEFAKIGDIIQDVVNLCSNKLKVNSVDLRVQQIDASLGFECRAVQIAQVVLNLINNASDAIDGLAEKWIQIEANKKVDRLEIRVTDSGKGISRDIAERIFEPFFTTKEVGKGTGLGLSISKGIILEHAGQLYVDLGSIHTSFVIDVPIKSAKNI